MDGPEEMARTHILTSGLRVMGGLPASKYLIPSYGCRDTEVHPSLGISVMLGNISSYGFGGTQARGEVGLWSLSPYSTGL